MSFLNEKEVNHKFQKGVAILSPTVELLLQTLLNAMYFAKEMAQNSVVAQAGLMSTISMGLSRLPHQPQQPVFHQQQYRQLEATSTMAARLKVTTSELCRPKVLPQRP
jgi:hypothetical protein